MLPLAAKVVIVLIFVIGFALVAWRALSERDEFADLREDEEERHLQALEALQASHAVAQRSEYSLHAHRVQSIRKMASDAAQRRRLGHGEWRSTGTPFRCPTEPPPRKP